MDERCRSDIPRRIGLYQAREKEICFAETSARSIFARRECPLTRIIRHRLLPMADDSGCHLIVSA
ncbi:hypothetical protein EN828_31190 [Mesorhizobium sp. M2D.F.Ca.ET.185.01.1.1]|uniref:hypothetical protein n=1 Tax=unclassified Mesorhizobium TaxID=325217 RepID=UPI000FCCCD2E|nr:MULTISPECIES: hypothetical protein [unclassified Mesorhizobium]TGP56718.1 hypothetical protein EN873_00950 [bacterium M00.F.Ca.ET.230.01.1.1]TGP75391.1 hypothetical protein EN870_24285 [bacterium M00.F.Ca.ET.227.01.1.1]TGP90269.1 hypothetical protein EN865_23690 [bacterium M00.F.Ca.ET.222.01.1.1]TGP96414.1 hypothetical protein EN864_07950 [bacterium M00.F.Ca.ET.221.01.1.1]TGT67524.1 hypothetical protein EN802_29960 [bacterium M00.F.Ca.ET.159.01.1.1]TGT79842.1 hypothetical protein EN800_288